MLDDIPDHMDPLRVAAARCAGAATARYCPADPVHWLSQAALNGMHFFVMAEGGFVICEIDAEAEDAAFAEAWLAASPGAKEAVEQLLRQRGVEIL